MWQLGLSVMEMATLKPSSEVYDKKDKSLKQAILTERVNFIGKFYAPELCHIVRMMIEFDPLIRPDAILMNRMLQ